MLTALQVITRAREEIAGLLHENARLKGGLPARELEKRGLQDEATVAERIQHNLDAITLIYREAMSITAEPGLGRATAGMNFEKSTPPTERELEAFFLREDPWSSSLPFPQSLQEWADALGQAKADKAGILAEIGQRTKGRRARIEQRYARETAALINLAAARIFAAQMAGPLEHINKYYSRIVGGVAG